jgi:plasmid maintenance system killer protein
LSIEQGQDIDFFSPILTSLGLPADLAPALFKQVYQIFIVIRDDFFEVMAIIEAAESEQDLYANKGLRFEKLSGQRGKKDQRSLRLNKQWRLIVILETDEDGKYVLILDKYIGGINYKTEKIDLQGN